MTMNQVQTVADHYECTDLSLCAALRVCGYEIDRIDKANPRRAIFFIVSDERLGEVVGKYFSHQLRIDPALFAYHLKDLKTQIYQK